MEKKRGNGVNEGEYVAGRQRRPLRERVPLQEVDRKRFRKRTALLNVDGQRSDIKKDRKNLL